MHDVPLLINITVALVVAFFGGLVARRIGLPTIVGYLLAGIVIGPFTPGFVGDVSTIQELAELGVIFLMFGVGLHFSFQDLLRVRDIAIPGALIQSALSTLLGIGISRLWGWPLGAGIILGLAISVASTVVLLRGLMDHGLLNTAHGQAAVGWLVMEDILSVLILVLMPAFAPGSHGFDWQALAITLLKFAAFAVIMFFAGARLIPWLLERMARTRSRELFILAVLAIALGTAMGAAQLFGVSLALGAFVAGAIISQSHLSHQVGADVLPFREAFAVLFFVSIGMLVNPAFLWQNIGPVLALTLLIVAGKAIITLLLGLVIRRPARTFLVVAVGLSQIGEFSFILGKGGMALNLLDANQYGLILAGALLSITLNPLMYWLMPGLEKLLQRVPSFWKRLDLNTPLPAEDGSGLAQHVVIIGYGRVGKHMVEVLESLNVPHLVIESDAEQIQVLNARKTVTLYGDAANSEVITHAGLAQARALVITIPDETTSAMIVSAARTINSQLPIITRVATEAGIHHLARLGDAHLHVVHPELEGSLEMVHHTLLQLGYPLREVHEYAEAVRRDHYNLSIDSDAEHRSIHDLLMAFDSIEITWIPLQASSPLIGQTLADANLRAHTGASVVAMIRDNQLIANPKSVTVFTIDDRIGLIGESEQIERARGLANGPV
jgi:monovalent cation:H+ antiporter-2, CPA2 family